MSIITLQRRMRELGRIRTGVQVPKSGGGTRPEKLETFRLTSDSRQLIEAAAEAYGGDVDQWQGPDGLEWQVITKADALEIVVPPGQVVTQWYEMWAAGGCQRRCDGQRNVLTDGPCLCPEDVEERIKLAAKGQACKATTRLSVILPRIPDLGVWRLESHGFYAAVELAGAAEILSAASANGRLIPARLRLDQRSKKVPGQQTKRYGVPVIEFTETRMAELMPAIQAGAAAKQLAAGGTTERPALPPGPALPPASDFRAPAPAQDAPGDDDEPNAAADTAAAAVDAQQPGLTREQLLDWLASVQISAPYAMDVAKRAVPGFDGTRALEPAERAVLQKALEAEIPEGAML
jgi:hypothetical protein